MKTFAGLGVAVLLIGATEGRAADTHEQLIKDHIKVFKSVSDLLATVKDEDTAKKAKPELKKLALKLQDLKKRGEKLGKPGEEENKKLEKKYKPEIQKALTKFFAESQRVGTVPGGKDLLKELAPKKTGPKSPDKEKKSDK